MTIEDIFARYAPAIDNTLRSLVPDSPPGLAAMLRYHLGWVDASGHPVSAKSGKLLRPTLCLLCCEASGGQSAEALPAAAALELLHNFSLVHDDIQDRSAERRHRATVWSIWGEPQAINVGDALFALAHQALYRLSTGRAAPELALTAARYLEEAAVALCGGQYLDMSFEARPEVSTEEYFEMVRGKTAALLGCSCAIGALLGSGDESVAGCYRRFGESLGIAFQIQDDILGIWGDPRITGKPAADDVRARKKTLPIAWALETLSGPPRERLAALYRLPTLMEEQVEETMAILDEHGARVNADKLAAQWCARALADLDAARPLPVPAEQLRAITAFLVGRTY